MFTKILLFLDYFGLSPICPKHKTWYRYYGRVDNKTTCTGCRHESNSNIKKTVRKYLDKMPKIDD